MIKRWNNTHSKYLKSFHIEVMVAKTFNSLGDDSRNACEKFFLWVRTTSTSPTLPDTVEPCPHI